MKELRNATSLRELNECKEMASYIHKIIRGTTTQGETKNGVTTFGLSNRACIYFSWGVTKPSMMISKDNSFGLQIRVRGRKLKGLVRIWYNNGADLFNVEFINWGGTKLVKTCDGIYLDQLQEVIDETIEKNI